MVKLKHFVPSNYRAVVPEREGGFRVGPDGNIVMVKLQK
jgi:hypothetical protein